MFREFNFIKESYICDPVSAILVYHGWYAPSNTGTPVDTAKAQFLIAKEVKNAGGITTSMKWSGRSYDQIWDNRGTINYD